MLIVSILEADVALNKDNLTGLHSFNYILPYYNTQINIIFTGCIRKTDKRTTL